jgi:hypothetical protein
MVFVMIVVVENSLKIVIADIFRNAQNTLYQNQSKKQINSKYKENTKEI